MTAIAMAQSSMQGLRLRLILLLVAFVSGTVLTMGIYAAGAFERAVAPELAKRALLIGTIVRGELQRALELGMQLDSITGLERYLGDTLRKFDEVERIVVRDVNDVTVAAVERPAAAGAALFPLASSPARKRGGYVLAILDGNRLMGEIQVDIRPGFVRSRLREVLLDVMVLALVAVLVALELTLLLAATSVDRPLERLSRLLDAQRNGTFLQRIQTGGLGGLARATERLNDHAQDLAERMSALPAAVRQGLEERMGMRIAQGRPTLLRLSDVVDVRLALFLFSTATEVAVAFLPVYARTMARPEWLSAEMAAAAPLVCYLFAILALTPLGGALARRFGARRMFLMSVPPTMIGLLGLAYANHVVEVALWRGMMAVFYATATIACQEYALRASNDGGSARPAGAFVTVVYGGVFCGAALGGVLAGRFGFSAALIGGAVLAALSGALGAVMMRGPAGEALERMTPKAATPAVRHIPPGLAGLLLGLAVPMSATTAVFVWYLVPLLMSAAGSGPAEISRVVMLYYLTVVLLNPTVISLADGRMGPHALVTAGAAVAALALLSLNWWSGFWPIVVAMAGLGVGHTMMRAPLFAVVQRIGREGSAVGALRVSERLGAIAGLGLCALTMPAFGPDLVIRALGIVALVGLAGYVVMLGFARPRPQ